MCLSFNETQVYYSSSKSRLAAVRLQHMLTRFSYSAPLTVPTKSPLLHVGSQNVEWKRQSGCKNEYLKKMLSSNIRTRVHVGMWEFRDNPIWLFLLWDWTCPSLHYAYYMTVSITCLFFIYIIWWWNGEDRAEIRGMIWNILSSQQRLMVDV